MTLPNTPLIKLYRTMRRSRSFGAVHVLCHRRLGVRHRADAQRLRRHGAELTGTVTKRRITGLVIGLLGWTSAASAQRVLECQFVSVEPSSFVYGKWSFAADISHGRLAMLLARPSAGTGSGTGDPLVRAFSPTPDGGASVYHDVSAGSGESGPTATFQMATTGANDRVTLDEWRFGNTEEYDRLILRCPSHQ